jgi:transcriptional regulator with XRE-family HTH domain
MGKPGVSRQGEAVATIDGVTLVQLGQVVRTLRHRQGLTMVELGRRAGISRGPVQRLEAGRGADIAAGVIVAIVEALGGRVDWDLRWRGAALDRVLDEAHALLVAEMTRRLRRAGWQVELEVSFAIYRDRGSIDILAWHAATATLLVVEVKSELGSVEGLLRPFDVKLRLAAGIARDRFGWRPTAVAGIVAFPDESSVRRQVERHATVFDSALPARSRACAAWLRQPNGPLRGLWFLSGASSTCRTRNPSARRRIRTVKAAGCRARSSSG